MSIVVDHREAKSEVRRAILGLVLGTATLDRVEQEATDMVETMSTVIDKPFAVKQIMGLAKASPPHAVKLIDVFPDATLVPWVAVSLRVITAPIVIPLLILRRAWRYFTNGET